MLLTPLPGGRQAPSIVNTPAEKVDISQDVNKHFSIYCGMTALIILPTNIFTHHSDRDTVD